MDAARMRVVRARRLARDVKERERVAARGELDGARAQERARALLAGHGGVARVVWSAIARGRVTVARSFWQSCGSARHYVVLLEPALHGAPRRRPGPPPSGRGRALDGAPTVVPNIPTTAPDTPAPATAAPPKTGQTGPATGPQTGPKKTGQGKGAAVKRGSSSRSSGTVPVDARAARLTELRGKFPASTSLLHNWRQTGRIASLEFRDDGGAGPIHAAVFVNTAIAALPDGGGLVERSGRGESKKAAQFAAADELILALADITSPPPPKPPKPRPILIWPDRQDPNQQVPVPPSAGPADGVSAGGVPAGGSSGPAGGSTLPVTQLRVLTALDAGHRRTKDIAAAAGMASSNTSTALRHLAAAGLARSTDRGRWEPVSQNPGS